MRCGLEAIGIKAEIVQKHREEQKNFRMEYEKEITENAIRFCETVVAPILERKMKDPNATDWGTLEVLIDTRFAKEPKKLRTAHLLETTTSHYADHRLSYKFSKTFENEINFDYLKKYLNDYCWDFECYSFMGFMKGCGERTFTRIKFKPMPKCL